MLNAKHGPPLESTVAVSAKGNAIYRRGSNAAAPSAVTTVARGDPADALRPIYSPAVLVGVVRIVETALIVVIGLICYLWCAPASADSAWRFLNILAVCLTAVFTFQYANLYQLRAFRGHDKPCLRLTLAWSAAFLIVFGAFRLAELDYGSSRLWLGSYYLAGLPILLSFRRILFVLVCRWTQQGRFDRPTVVVGGGQDGEALIAQLAAQRDSDVRIIGVFDDRGNDRSPADCYGVPKLGNVDDLVEFVRHTRVDLVVLALPIAAEERVLHMLKKLWILPVDIRLAAHRSKLQLRPRSYSYIGSVPVFDMFDRPIANWDVVAKWLFDKIVGTVALICVAPVMLTVALAIKFESKGPILFKQRRHGFNNEIFEIYKFRSMYVEHTDAMAQNIVTRNDPRITRVGRFLRKTSLDELPQLFNVVFVGNMSVVGPRPHPIYLKAEGLLFNEVVDGYFARHRVKPGMTGWAQINGWRGGADSFEKIERRVEHDLYYIENWWIGFDFWILARTPFALTRGEGAY